MTEEVPERVARVFAKMGRVINDDVKPLGCDFGSYSVKYFWILLKALVHVDAARIILDRYGIQIQTRNMPSWEQITPQIHRTTPLDAELQ